MSHNHRNHLHLAKSRPC
ncbi:rCG52252 [Rattus norvegicus]|uniref:RCG52252 n=1 Tax=Rattus norvegicus TaxID=10116 RepID=A6K6N0_RAT|nr:rCG52252 [Rattus norvegicus]